MELVGLCACHRYRIVMTATREGTDHDILAAVSLAASLQDHFRTDQHLGFRALLLYCVWVVYRCTLHELIATCLELARLVRC